MAGAIEAVASTAGQLMPPILGLAGFLIAALLNIPYIKVAGAALLPALPVFNRHIHQRVAIRKTATDPEAD